MNLASFAPVGNALQAAARPEQPDPIRKTAEEFEAVFLTTVIGRMFETLPTDGPFGGGHAEATFRSLLAEEYASEVARGGGIGVADAVYEELLKIQEASGQ